MNYGAFGLVEVVGSSNAILVIDQMLKTSDVSFLTWQTKCGGHATVFVVKEGGEKPNLGEDALCHWDLLKKYNLVDFDLGVKITGAGFPVYIGKMARFQRALEAFFLDEARKSGYLEIQPPYVVNEDSGRGTGQLPDKEGQMYHANLDNLFLIPTAEVPVTNIFRDVILDEKDLPIKRCAYSACFRREAGSYGPLGLDHL